MSDISKLSGRQASPVLRVLVLGALAFIGAAVTASSDRPVFAEGGPVEHVSMWLLAISGLYAFGWCILSRKPQFVFVTVFLFLLAERESEQGLAFVTSDPLSAEFWQRSMSVEWLANALLLAVLVLALVLLVIAGIPALMRGLRDRANWVGLALILPCAIIVSHFAESSGLVAVEESAELVFAIGVLVSLSSFTDWV